MRWVLGFSGLCLGLLAGVLLALWMLNGFSGFGLSVHGTIALVLGVVFTSALAVVLMALVFYSSRSGQDDAVHDRNARRRDRGLR